MVSQIMLMYYPSSSSIKHELGSFSADLQCGKTGNHKFSEVDADKYWMDLYRGTLSTMCDVHAY